MNSHASRLDFETLLKQILVAIRGAWTQEEMSEKLGYSSLQVHRWENLKVSLNWINFVEICELRRAPISMAFEKFYAYKGDLKNCTTVLHLIRAGVAQKELTEKTGIKPTRLSKILNGHHIPEMLEILQIMFACQSWFWEFWAEIAKPSKTPMIQNEIERKERQVSLSVRFPFAAALLATLRLKKYRDTDLDTATFLANELQVNISAIKTALVALLDAGFVQKDQDKYKVQSSDVNLGRDFQSAKVIIEYWTQRQLNLLKQSSKKPQHSFFPYLTVPLNEKSVDQVRHLFVELYQKIITLAKQDPDHNDNIYVYTAGFVRTDEKPTRQIPDDTKGS